MLSRASSCTVRYSTSPAFGRRARSASACRSNTTNGMASRCNRWAITSPAGPAPTIATPGLPDIPTSAEPFEHEGHALAAADAHGLEADLLVVELQRVDQRGGDPGSGHAERVTNRDGAAVDVEPVDIDAQVAV